MSNKETFPAEPNHVWQIPYQAVEDSPNTPVGSFFSDKLVATEDGIVAKNAFVVSSGKHPTRNIYTFFRREIGDIVFHPDEYDLQQVERQEWMDKTEDDALAEIENKAADPATHIQESLLESILTAKRSG